VENPSDDLNSHLFLINKKGLKFKKIQSRLIVFCTVGASRPGSLSCEQHPVGGKGQAALPLSSPAQGQGWQAGHPGRTNIS
jgi:hypothetical protein